MATAMAFPEAKRGRGNIDPSKCDSESHFSQKTLERARYVLRNSPMVEGDRYPRRCLSTNVHRRHLTKGQQAMAVALAYPESKQGKRNKETSGLNHEVEESYIRRARFVLRHCLDKAEEVLLNSNYPLTKAYHDSSRPYREGSIIPFPVVAFSRLYRVAASRRHSSAMPRAHSRNSALARYGYRG